MTPPRISVVIPVKDDAVELARCLAALGLQTLVADEVLVVDNGSTDASAEVARRAGAIVLECVSGAIPAASAHGYDNATGDLILRLDADCVPGRGWIAEMAAAFARRPDIAAYTGRARFIDGPAVLRGPLALAYLAAYALLASSALGHLPLFGSNLALRREAWMAVRSDIHRHADDIHDDFDLAFHLGAAHRIGYARGSAMGMSMRPFRSARSMRLRVQRGYRTVLVHWPEDFPPRRWARLRRVRGGAARVTEPA